MTINTVDGINMKRPMTLRICPRCGSEKLVSTYAMQHGQNLICRSCASKKVNAEMHKNKPTVCSIEGCDRKYKGKGLCDMHLWRLRHNGNPHVTKIDVTGANVRHPLFVTYQSMKSRCFYVEAPNYKHYGGRGITMCDKWLGKDGFQNFVKDMGNRPAGMTIDRIDVDGNYEPANVRWATKSEQMLNTRKHKENKL